MIYQATLKELNDEELSILFLIFDKFFRPINIEAKIDYIKMLRLNVICSMIDVLKGQALEEYKNVFESLKNKLLSQ